MRKLVSILFLSLLLLQGVPVLHFFFAQKEVFYAYIDEEKPTEKGKETAADRNATAPALPPVPETEDTKSPFSAYRMALYAPPSLEFTAPPPDAC